MQAIPSPFTTHSVAPPSETPAASSRVQNGAVDPATGVPGLYEKPAPSAMLRAKWRWIQGSSSGSPGAPAIACSRRR
ncbi:MAG: hypothetical protein HY217_04030 [Candidatus Rokubacteria bacterium]|nr:hypothetical protein [Candidatus Rokubacteria bacterium]